MGIFKIFYSWQSDLPGYETRNIIQDSIKDAVDCNIYFFGERVEPYAMYIVLISSIILLVGGYILLNIFRKKDK